MYVVLYFTDGKKLISETKKLYWFSSTRIAMSDGPVMLGIPEPREGQITVNLDNVTYIRPADSEEIKSAQLHGW